MSEKLAVQQMDIHRIRPYEKNPRLNGEAVLAVAKSIKAYGFQQPILIDGDMVIICGHTRYKAAQSLGLNTVPCIVIADLSPDKVRAFRLADNQVSSIAKWDFDKLWSELEGLPEELYNGFLFDELKKTADSCLDRLDEAIAAAEKKEKPTFLYKASFTGYDLSKMNQAVHEMKMVSGVEVKHNW